MPTADDQLLAQTHQPAAQSDPKPTRGVGWVEPQVFDIYGLDASRRGSSRMPPRTTLLCKRGDRIVALRRDPDGVHRVDLYELRNRIESERE